MVAVMEVGHHSVPHQLKQPIRERLRMILSTRAHRKAVALLPGQQRYECCTAQEGLAAAQPDFFHSTPLLRLSSFPSITNTPTMLG
jgi:hypothetical protein